MQATKDTASVITGCSPVRAAPPISRACANCSVLPGDPKPQSRPGGRSDGLAAMPLLRRAHDRHRVLRARNAAAIARAIPGRHLDRHVMSWNRLLDCRLPPPLTAGSQAAKPTLCPRRPPSAKLTPKPLLPELSSRPSRRQIPRNKPYAAQYAHVPLNAAAALLPKSP